VSRLYRQCRTLNFSQLYRPPRPVTGIALLYFTSLLITQSWFLYVRPWHKFWKFSVQTFVRTPIKVSETYHSFSQSIYIDSEPVSRLQHKLPSKFSPVHQYDFHPESLGLNSKHWMRCRALYQQPTVTSSINLRPHFLSTLPQVRSGVCAIRMRWSQRDQLIGYFKPRNWIRDYMQSNCRNYLCQFSFLHMWKVVFVTSRNLVNYLSIWCSV
jgi:hypothetical protein